MVRLNPCCSLVSLQTGSKIVAVLDMLMGVFKIAWFIFMLKEYGIVSFQMIEEGESDDVIETEKKLSHLDLMPVFNATSNKVLSSHKAVSLLTLAAYNIEGTVVNLIIFVVLYIGAARKSVAKCLTWFYIRGTVLLFKLTIVIICLIAGRTFLSQLPFIVVMLVHVYGLWIVSEFVDEIKRGKNEKESASEEGHNSNNANSKKSGA